MRKLPVLTQSVLLDVDATPNEGYPLRILQAYRQNCDCMFADNTAGMETLNPVILMMNKDNRKRAEILDKAIRKLMGG